MKGPRNKTATIAALVTAILITSLLFISQPLLPLTEAQSSSPSPPPSEGSSGNFSVIWITDTQYLSSVYPTYFDALCRWIVNNAQKYNIKMVIHTGDIVDTEGNQSQWANANHSMSLLLDADIPYCWNAGNHDYNATCWIGNQYAAFNPALLAGKSYWIGDEFNGQNTAIHVNASGWDLLVVNLQNLANESALNWANSIIDAYPYSHVIVATHAFLNSQGKYTYALSGQNDSWANDLNDTVLQNHPSVFLTLSGHFNTNNGRQNRVGDRTDLMFNRQDQDGSLGGATLRILTFDTADGVIDVKTFVLYANTFLTDTNDQFAVNTPFYNTYAQGASKPTPTPKPTPEFSFAAISVFLAASTATLLAYRGYFRKPKSIE